MHIFMDRQLECADQRRFHRGDVYFAVALTGVAVPYLQQRSGSMHGKKKRRSGDEFFIVDISAMDPWRRAADPPSQFRRRHAYTSKKGSPRNIDSGAASSDSAFVVQRNNFYPSSW